MSLFCGLALTVLTATRPCPATAISLATRQTQPSPEQLVAKARASSHSTWRVLDSSAARLSTWQEALSDNPSLFEGCKNVFLDVGSNRGTHVRKLFEPSQYPNAKYIQVFDKAFGKYRTGPASETGLCAFGFEANPRWVPRLLAIEKAYKANNWRVKFFAPSVVSNETGKATFWVNDDGKDSDWGASQFKDEDAVRAKKLVVDKLDMPHFMKALSEQTLPGGEKVMKMDIEGGEYTVLPPLLEHDLLCADTLNTLTIEWHRQAGAETLGSLPLVWAFEKQATNPQCGPVAPTEILSFDDESYREDGVPIPGFSDEDDANPEKKQQWRHLGKKAGVGSNCRGDKCLELRGR